MVIPFGLITPRLLDLEWEKQNVLLQLSLSHTKHNPNRVMVFGSSSGFFHLKWEGDAEVNFGGVE